MSERHPTESSNTVSSEKRTYKLKERARRQEQTRERIIQATVALHQEVGPAATTVAEIARRAGVSRLTVYNNFPTDGDMFAACQRRFLTNNPVPDLSAALAIDQPGERVRAVLALMYRSFRQQAPMSAKVLHDRGALPALDALLVRTRDASIAQLTTTLAGGFAARGAAGARLRALISLALDFWTWQRLTQEGLSDDKAARLMSDVVACAAASDSSPPSAPLGRAR
jgi:AcrR family transcriptional regulator